MWPNIFRRLLNVEKLPWNRGNDVSTERIETMLANS